MMPDVHDTTSRDARTFGTGWMSGTLSVVLGALGLGGVLCFIFPEVLTTPEVRNALPLPFLRGLLHVVLVSAFVLGGVSILFWRNRQMALTGMGLAMVAQALGGASLPERAVQSRYYLGLDWFLLNLFFLSLIFVPVERLFPLRVDQGPFRLGWRTDLAHFFTSHLLVQVSVFLTLAPAGVFFEWAVNATVQRAVAAQPAVLQFCEILIVSDLCEYWIHRFMHQVPALWKFHAIHHSCERMDWLAASRLHLVDIVIVRAVTFVPLFVLGFAQSAIFAYLVFVSFHAIFIHANVGFRFGVFETMLATPRFHHWHHSAAAEAIDKNFAVHLPVLDRLFGTLWLPRSGQWPEAYGITHSPVPDHFGGQIVYPFVRWRRRKAKGK